ncbi:DNA primase [Leuconostocaceae bacterium ESL0958]|nr:DNA primase [Leuconostocaceae bacterium ESL0958]
MAQRIPQAVIDEVRSKVDIVDVIRPYTDLVKRGREWNGSCPFHEDRHPSFFVDDQKQVFHCFSCGRSGTVFSFLMEKEGYSYPEAIVTLAKDAGLSIGDQYQQSASQQNRYQPIYDLYQRAQRLYTHILLNTTAGETALAYLKEERQLDEATIRRYGLGYVPASNELLTYVRSQEMDESLLTASNLFYERDGQLQGDRFAKRIVWPIQNERGQTLGFSGRSLDPDNPAKYMNSPESPFFNKGKLLYHLDQAQQTIRSKGQVMIFEGFMDVMAADLAGHEEAVATMGTALTGDHVKLLKRLADRVILVYDGDAAGQKAAKRAIPLLSAQAPDLELGVIKLPDEHDPDEIRRLQGRQALADVLNQTVLTPTEFLIQGAKNGRNLSKQSQYLDFLKEAMAVLANASPVEQDYFLHQFEQEYGTSRSALESELAQAQAAQPSVADREFAEAGPDLPEGLPSDLQGAGPGPATVNPGQSVWADRPRPQVSQVEQAERGLLMAMMKEPAVYDRVQAMPNFAFQHPDYQLIMMLIAAYQQEHKGPFDLAAFMDYLQKPALNQKLMAMDRDFGTLEVQPDAVDDYLRLILKEGPFEEQVQAIEAQMAVAKSQHDDQALLSLSAQLIQLKRAHATNT